MGKLCPAGTVCWADVLQGSTDSESLGSCSVKKKNIFISRFMFQHIKPPDKQEDKHLHWRQQISHSGRTTRPLWYPSAVWCFLHRTYEGWKGWLNMCYCFPACIRMSAFKNHPNDTRLLYILMTIRVMGYDLLWNALLTSTTKRWRPLLDRCEKN